MIPKRILTGRHEDSLYLTTMYNCLDVYIAYVMYIQHMIDHDMTSVLTMYFNPSVIE
jgi:hypothetical protein